MAANRAGNVDKNGLSKHHVLFYHSTWSSHKALLKLRGNRQLIPRIDREVHNDLHNDISCVPPLSIPLAEAVLARFIEYDNTQDSIKAAENLQRSIEDALNEEGQHFDTVEHMIGEMAIYAINLQKPYIQPPSSAVHIDMKHDNMRPSLLWTPEHLPDIV